MKPIDVNRAASDLGNRIRESQASRDRMRGEEARYSLVLHGPRKELGLSLVEYVLADTINKLSSVHSPVPGWCIASKETLARGLNITERQVFRLIKALTEKRLVEVHPDTHHLRASETWYSTVEVTKNEVFRRR